MEVLIAKLFKGDIMELEKKLKEIEEIVSKLENPDLNMDEGVILYEKGAQIIKDCYEVLNATKGKVNVIKKELESYKEEALD